MSHSGKRSSSEKPPDKLADRLRKSSLTSDGDKTDKPDFRETKLGSGSPISPLRGGPTVSSSSSSSGSVSGRTGSGISGVPVRPGSGGGSRKSDSGSGELSADNSPTFSRGGKSGTGTGTGTTRTESSGPIYSGASSVSSPAAVNVLPSGNICPSGRVPKTGMMSNRSSKPEVLNSGNRNYGHGSIMRGNPTSISISPGGKETRATVNPEDLKNSGNEEYKKGNFQEALKFYDRAIALSPRNAAYHSNRAAALIGLKRLTEAVKACNEAIKLEPTYVKAHHRLGSILLSLGHVDMAKVYLYYKGYNHPDPKEVQRYQAVVHHIKRSHECRKVKDWAGFLRESDAGISLGADSCYELFASKAEALFHLRKLDEADAVLLNAPRFEVTRSVKFYGMLSQAYLAFVRAQIDMALGRFDNAITSIQKAEQLDPKNLEIALLWQNSRALSRARTRGNDHFKAERFTEACADYGDGLRCDPSNPVLFSNRAACWFKIGEFEKSLEDCNKALQINPKYTKALLRRAATYSKLEKWAESVKDYQVLRSELPDDNSIAESLFHAQIALKKSLGEEVYNMKFGGEVEVIKSLELLKAAVASTGASVVLFKTNSDSQCKYLSPFLDTLCTRYPSLSFFKVDIEESKEIASAENIKMVPTVKIYKKGNRMKEMVRPSPEALEATVYHYSTLL